RGRDRAAAAARALGLDHLAFDRGRGGRRLGLGSGDEVGRHGREWQGPRRNARGRRVRVLRRGPGRNDGRRQGRHRPPHEFVPPLLCRRPHKTRWRVPPENRIASGSDTLASVAGSNGLEELAGCIGRDYSAEWRGVEPAGPGGAGRNLWRDVRPRKGSRTLEIVKLTKSLKGVRP